MHCVLYDLLLFFFSIQDTHPNDRILESHLLKLLLFPTRLLLSFPVPILEAHQSNPHRLLPATGR